MQHEMIRMLYMKKLFKVDDPDHTYTVFTKGLDGV